MNVIVIFLAHILGISPPTPTPTSSSTKWSTKWIQSCNGLLLTITTVYLTLIVLVECTVRILLVKAGIAAIPRVRNTLELNLDRRIEESLVTIDIDPTTNGDSEYTTSFCAICLEEFDADTTKTVVAGRRDCCKSNRFHEACIKPWLRTKNSCPCCRQAMIVTEIECESESKIECDSDSEEHESSLRWQLQSRIDSATVLRNEILSYYRPVILGCSGAQ